MRLFEDIILWLTVLAIIVGWFMYLFHDHSIA